MGPWRRCGRRPRPGSRGRARGPRWPRGRRCAVRRPAGKVFVGFGPLAQTARSAVMHECAVVRGSAVAQGRSSAHTAKQTKSVHEFCCTGGRWRPEASAEEGGVGAGTTTSPDEGKGGGCRQTHGHLLRAETARFGGSHLA